MGTVLGFEAKLYYNTGTYNSPSHVEVALVKDATVTMEDDEADVSARDGAGWSYVVQGLRKAGVDFSMRYDPADTAWQALKTAYLTRTPLEFFIMDGDVEDANSEGLRATCAVLKFTRNENLGDPLMTDFTIKPTPSDHAPEWVEGNAAYT